MARVGAGRTSGGVGADVVSLHRVSARGVQVDAVARESVDDESPNDGASAGEREANRCAGARPVEFDCRRARPPWLLLGIEDHRGAEGGQRRRRADRRDAAGEVVVGGAQAGAARAIRDHEDGVFRRGNQTRLTQARIAAESNGVGDELPQRALAAVIRVDDRVEVEAEVDACDVRRPERDGRDRLCRRRSCRQRDKGSAAVARVNLGRRFAAHVVGYCDGGAAAGVRAVGLHGQMRPGDVACPR